MFFKKIWTYSFLSSGVSLSALYLATLGTPTFLIMISISIVSFPANYSSYWRMYLPQKRVPSSLIWRNTSARVCPERVRRRVHRVLPRRSAHWCTWCPSQKCGSPHPRKPWSHSADSSCLPTGPHVAGSRNPSPGGLGHPRPLLW